MNTQEDLRAEFEIADNRMAEETAAANNGVSICRCSSCVDARFHMWLDKRPQFPAPAPAATQEALPLETWMERRLRVLSDYPIVVIPDDEVTDMGSYFLWNKYDGSQKFIMDASITEDIVASYTNLRSWYGIEHASRVRADATSHVHVYINAADKPLMVHGTFKYTGIAGYDSDRVIYRYYMPTRNSRELIVVNVDPYNGSVTTSRRDHYATIERPGGYTVKRARVADIDRAYRAKLFARLIDAKYNCGHINLTQRVELADRLGAIARMSNPNSLYDLRTYWRGCSLWVFKGMREVLREAGHMIAKVDDYEASEIIDILERVEAFNPDSAGRVRDAWNIRCSSSDEVTRASCGHWTAESDTRSTVDGDVCESCFDENYEVPVDSDGYYHRDNLHRHENGQLYTYSEHNDDDDDEGEDNVGGLVKNYTANALRYVPADATITPSVFGDFLMGVELEVVPKRRYRRAAVTDTQTGLCKGYAIMKNDGSLDDGGFEIVTAPRGLKEHIERFTAWTPHEKLRAWDPGCCGLHVHMSSSAFSQATLGKFIEFINAGDNQRLIEAIAGRHANTDSQARQYCQVEGSLAVGNPKKTVQGKSNNRYYMVNTANLSSREASRLGVSLYAEKDNPINTVELRIFRASLKKERLLAQIEFAHAAVMFCRATSMRELRQQHFLAWLRGAAGVYPNLAKWFGVKANTSVIVESPPVQALAEV